LVVAATALSARPQDDLQLDAHLLPPLEQQPDESFRVVRAGALTTNSAKLPSR
jgi:hypothetical protein